MAEGTPIPSTPDMTPADGSAGMPIGMPAWAPRALAWLLLIVFAVSLAACIIVPVPKTIDGAFVLLPVNGAARIRAPGDGFVEHGGANEGQAVDADQVLFTLRSSAEDSTVVTVKAPMAGVILQKDVVDGAAVQAGQVLARVVNNGSPLWAVIELPEESLASVKPGQPVQLLFAAYSHYRFGVTHAVIRQVHVVPAKVGDTYCLRAYAELIDAGIRQHGKRHPFLAGLRGEARIVIGRSPLITSLVGP